MAFLSKVLQLFDTGTEIVLRIIDPAGEVVNIGETARLAIIFARPNGTTFTREATLVTDGADGLLRYTTVGGDIDAAGQWKLQGLVQFSNGTQKFRSRVLLMTVERNVSGDSVICPQPLDFSLEIPTVAIA